MALLPPRVYDALQQFVHGGHQGTIRQIVTSLDVAPGGGICEIGCGTGGVLHHIDDAGVRGLLTTVLDDQPGRRLFIIEPLMSGASWCFPVATSAARLDEGKIVRTHDAWIDLVRPWMVGTYTRSLLPRWPVRMLDMHLEGT